MSADPGAGGITVQGGSGGFAVSLDDLLAAIVSLRECSDLMYAVSNRAQHLDVLTGAVTRTAPVEVLARVDWDQSGVSLDLGRLALALERHAWDTRAVVNAYALAEHEAAMAIVVARFGVPALLRERWRLQGLGLFAERAAAPVEALPVDPETRVELWDVASLVTSQSLLSGSSTVRVIEQPRPEGGSAWVVQIPGTLGWSPLPGEAPNDVTADLQLMALERAALTEAVLGALAAAQGAAGRLGRRDPVMLTGHSLGGIAAASLAADAAARTDFHITHVVTVGSPVGYLPVPEEVEVLSFEHAGDMVPRLDLVSNPDRESWTTVHREVPDARMLPRGSGPGEHDSITYRETARLAAVAIELRADPSLVRWAATAAPFLRAPTSAGASRSTQVVRDYRVSRVTESRS